MRSSRVIAARGVTMQSLPSTLVKDSFRHKR
jgi:hypothetical protein